jgi:hypothetical protein
MLYRGARSPGRLSLRAEDAINTAAASTPQNHLIWARPLTQHQTAADVQIGG